MKRVKKRFLPILITLAMILSSLSIGSVSVLAIDPLTPAAAHTVSAPSKNLQLHFWLDESGTPFYNVFLNNSALIENSKLGLETSLGSLKTGLTLSDNRSSSGNETWSPVVGEKSTIKDEYNQTSFTLTHQNGLQFTIEMRAYDSGVALRYILPKSENSYRISQEYTQFVFPSGTTGQAHIGGNQTVPTKVFVEDFGSSTYQRPMTLSYANGAVLTISEANLDNYSVMLLSKDSSTPRALKANYGANTVTVSGGSPTATPWRALVAAESLEQLPLNSDLILNLNDPADESVYKFSEWVKPGKNLMLGAGKETTQTLKTWIDTAKKEGLDYILLDYGWYGPELDDRCDPRLDPTKLDPEAGDSAELAAVKTLMKQFIVGDSHFDAGEGFPPYGLIDGTPVPGWPTGGTFAPNLNMKEICAYANSQGIGMILYVNGRHMFDKYGRYTPEELFARFEEWGVAGVKPGFVSVRDQNSEKRNLEMIKSAARHKLVLTIHDEYVPTGIERTYPNCLTTEGILGDEGIKGHQIAEDIATLFTRPIQGPTDHTFCYPGKATKGYALASPVLFRTGLQSLYWYGNPSSLATIPEKEKEFWHNMPATWDDLRVIEASMSEYATYARKTGEEWYVGSISSITRVMDVPLDFLDKSKTYVAEIYADPIGLSGKDKIKDSSELICEKYRVTSETMLTRPMLYGSGFAARIRPALPGDEQLPAFDGYREKLRNILAEVSALDEADYTIATWKTLADQVVSAQALLVEGATPSPDELTQAASNLLKALDDLRSVIVLTQKLDEAKCLVKSHYTSASWSVLEQSMIAAHEILASSSVTQAQLDQAAEGMTQALRQLVPLELEQGETVYLSDLEYEPNSTSSWGAIRKDRSHENPKLELMVSGIKTAFDKGLGIHADSNVYYNIESKGYEYFEAMVGVDAIKPIQGNIAFRVYSDDVLIYESKPSGTGSQNAQKIRVPVANTKILRLEADMLGSDNGDHGDWADAKFVNMKPVDPESTITGISINGAACAEFSALRTEYFYPVKAGDPVPAVTVKVPAESLKYTIVPAKKVPGTTEIHVTRPDQSEITYLVHFQTTKATYLSDLDWDAFDPVGSTYGSALKDKAFDGLAMLVSGTDGQAMSFPKVDGKQKGIGMHANCMLTYDIAGKGYGRFESWIGASHEKVYKNTMLFKVYFNDETVPRYTSPRMSHLKPAEFISLDLGGVNQIRLELDMIDVDNGDHGNWVEAKFLSYEDMPSEPDFAVNLNNITNVTNTIGSTFALPVRISAFPSGQGYKSIEGIISIPDGLKVKEAVPSIHMSPANFDYNLSSNTLRFAFVATDSEYPELKFDSSNSDELVNFTFELTQDHPADAPAVLAIDRFTVRTSENAMDYDLTNATASVEFVPPAVEITASARDLYAGDGTDLIPADRKAIAVEFTGLESAKMVTLDTVMLYHSPELTAKSGKSGVLTYIAYVSASLVTDSLTADAFVVGESEAESILFGDMDSDGINAQDALAILRVWLRKDAIDPEKATILVMNVNADAKLDTSDAVAVVDKFISQKDFEILNK